MCIRVLKYILEVLVLMEMMGHVLILNVLRLNEYI